MKTSLCKSRLNSERAYTTFKPCGKKAFRGTLTWTSGKGPSAKTRVLITQDLDFSDARKFVPGTHHGIVLIRLRSPSRRNLIARAPSPLTFDQEEVSGWAGCFVNATERKVRVRRPGAVRQ